MAVPVALAAPTDEQIGTWTLHCRDNGCLLRHQEHLLAKAGIAADLEIFGQGNDMIPAVVVRGVPSDPLLAMAAANRVRTSLQIGASAPVSLTCDAASEGYVCAPAQDAASSLAALIPAARSATVRVSVALAGGDATAPGSKTIALAGTKEALAQLRSAGAAPLPVRVPQPGNAWAGLLDKGLKAAGYRNGTADLPAFLEKYFNPPKTGETPDVR